LTTSLQSTLFDRLTPAARPLCLAERPLRDWPIGERPIERLLTCGAAAVSDVELLAALLSGTTGAANPVLLAEQLIGAFGGWHGLHRASADDLLRVAGLGRTRAAHLKAALEIARRLLLAQPGERLQIKSPTDAAQLMMIEMSHLDQEELRTVCLDTKNRVQRVATIYRGSLNASMIRVGEVFKEAVRLNSAAIIVGHNHPSGEPTPSPEDVLVTRQIVEAGQLFDIEVLDHLVIGQGRFVSMRERGLGFSR
jgi:DNA repair protein RadC